MMPPKPGHDGPPRVCVDIPTLLQDLQSSVESFASAMTCDPLTADGRPEHGSELAFNVAWWQMQPAHRLRAHVRRLGRGEPGARQLYLRLHKAELLGIPLAEGEHVAIEVKDRVLLGTVRTKGAVAWLGPRRGVMNNNALTAVMQGRKLRHGDDLDAAFLWRQ